MPDWLLPAFGLLGGGAGLGALINALVNAKGSAFTQLQTFTTTLQAERASDLERHNAERLEDREAAAVQRTKHDALDQRVNGLSQQVNLYKQFTSTLLNWGRAGGPPPEPIEPDGLSDRY